MELFLELIQVGLGLHDFALEFLGFFLAAFSRGSGHSPFHLLDGELSRIEQFLLPLLFLFEFVDVGLEVPAG